MTLPGHRSLQQVARATKGYPQLVVCLCEHFRIPLVRRGRYTFLADEHLVELAWRVDEWKRRPRLSRPARRAKHVPIAELVTA